MLLFFSFSSVVLSSSSFFFILIVAQVSRNRIMFCFFLLLCTHTHTSSY